MIDADFVKWDAAKREIAVKRATGKETSYTLATGCEVRIDGKPAKITDVKKGWPVRIVYNGESVIALGAYDKIDRPPYRGKR